MQNEPNITAKSRILVVDDDATMRLLMTETLAEDGYIIDEAENGPAALDMLKANAPDMVLLDVKMPGMSGFEVCSEIRALTGDTSISIVMVTGLDDAESIEKAFQLGATAFVTKPINWDTFPYRIQYLIKARNAIVELQQREQHLQHTERISRILTQGKNKDTIILDVLREMLDIFAADRACILTAQDNTCAKLDIVCEALREDCCSIGRSIGNAYENNNEILRWCTSSENPIVSTYVQKEQKSASKTADQTFHQMLKSLQVHNSHPWFLVLHRNTASREWSASEQETFYIISLRLAGILSRYLLMEKLHNSENLLRQAQRVGHIGNWHWSVKKSEMSWSDELYQIYGYSPRSFTPTVDNVLLGVAEEDLSKLDQFRSTIFHSEESYSVEHRIQLPNGRTRWLYQQAAGKLDSSGSLIEVNGIVQDITDRIKKQAQEAQNNKMEAIGQLTSGVAHDFGNLMTIARGNLELLDQAFLDEYGISAEYREILEDACSAVHDGVELTKHLLAFSRKKSLAQEFLNIESSITQYAKLFKNILGDKINLAIHVEDGLPDILVDTTQFESSLLNIIINARNAMPDGGFITIKAELKRYPDGQDDQNDDTDISDQAVSLSITDTGIGMTEDVLKHATEPFFTTRKNEGTGLGLSMVYAFMRQSRGDLAIDSRPGHGTGIRMQFPVYSGKESTVSRKTRDMATEKTRERTAPMSDATILVVEDRPEVRQFAVRCLDKLQLNVLQAEDAASAQTLLEKHNDIDLLFTDILMPGEMNGRDLAS
ncbi:MAG: response regulator, partial [Gammaproteobacteria bacterium]|nr:response regulator [Gammaproteobacteria bacterium]